MLKSPHDIKHQIQRRFAADWSDFACGQKPPQWPCRVALSTPTKTELESDFATMYRSITELNNWAATNRVEIETVRRRVGGSIQTIPTHVMVQDVRQAARILGEPFRRRLAVGERRARVLGELFPDRISEHSHVVRLLDTNACDDIDFDLVCRAALWFRDNDESGMTARQVPLEGFHAKWLDAKGHKTMVKLLAAKDTLELRERPRRIDFTYLDPAHQAAGLRKHDSLVEGDVAQPLYLPSIVIISENKDTALWFPPVEGGIAVQGDGWKGPELTSSLNWVVKAERVLYWGDMDAAGFAILNAYRSHGLNVQSIFMDMVSFERYEAYGVCVDAKGHAIPAQQPARLDYLTPSERELYLNVISENWTRPRRIEQERIPLKEVANLVNRIVNDID